MVEKRVLGNYPTKASQKQPPNTTQKFFLAQRLKSLTFPKNSFNPELYPLIIPHSNRLSADEEKELFAIADDFKVKIQPIVGHQRTIYAIIGEERFPHMIKRLEGLDFVDRVDTIQSPFKLMSRDSHLSSHQTKVGNKILGKEFVVVAGHCTIDPENPNYFYETVAALKEIGVDMIRGGVWKPRTSPYSFQGDMRSLDILLEARARTGLPINTEVMDFEQTRICVEAGVDSLQVGARNALNYKLLQQIGELTKTTQTKVMLKRSMHSGPINEFILAAEYIVAQGNPNVILVPRGTTPTIDAYRNAPDESITLLAKEKTWAPVVVDPSHSVGKAVYVPNACLAAAAYGADGILVETHCLPKKGIGDDPKQAITPDVLKKVIVDCKAIFANSRKYLHGENH